MDITCRDATEADLDFMYLVKQRAYQNYAMRAYGRWNEGFHRNYLKRHLPHTQIVRLDEQPVGWMAIKAHDNYLELVDLHLLPEYQRRGIGTHLIRQLHAAARRQRIPVRLEVLKLNPARALYERLGFTVVDETDTHSFMNCAADR